MKRFILILLFVSVALGIGFFIYRSVEGPGVVVNDNIRVDEPLPNSVVDSPLTIAGQARGPWYFEASFPVFLLDANRNIIVAHYAQAQDEWMTEEFVPFESVFEFAPPMTNTGFLVLAKDNPSGLPEHSASIEIPIRFR